MWNLEDDVLLRLFWKMIQDRESFKFYRTLIGFISGIRVGMVENFICYIFCNLSISTFSYLILVKRPRNDAAFQMPCTFLIFLQYFLLKHGFTVLTNPIYNHTNSYVYQMFFSSSVFKYWYCSIFQTFKLKKKIRWPIAPI